LERITREYGGTTVLKNTGRLAKMIGNETWVF
jgi:hypothetical protein